jgi:hypothetical protein
MLEEVFELTGTKGEWRKVHQIIQCRAGRRRSTVEQVIGLVPVVEY